MELWQRKVGAWIVGLAVCLMLATACGREEHAASRTENESGKQSGAANGEESEGGEQSYVAPASLDSNEDIENARKHIWQEYLDQVKQDQVRAEEVEKCAMTFGDAIMKYGIVVKGEPDDSGYSLFIALHGGGGSDTPDLNNSQWQHMGTYYQASVTNGIYVFPIGVRDTKQDFGKAGERRLRAGFRLRFRAGCEVFSLAGVRRGCRRRLDEVVSTGQPSYRDQSEKHAGMPLPLPDTYEVQMVDIEADSGGETEAGTTQRDVVRLGVVRISVSFSVSAKWLGLLKGG